MCRDSLGTFFFLFVHTFTKNIMAIVKLNEIPEVSYLKPEPFSELSIMTHIFSLFPDIEIVKTKAKESPGSTVSQSSGFHFAAIVKGNNIVITGQYPISNKFYFAKVLVAEDVISNDDVTSALKSSTGNGHIYKVTR